MGTGEGRPPAMVCSSNTPFDLSEVHHTNIHMHACATHKCGFEHPCDMYIIQVRAFLGL